MQLPIQITFRNFPPSEAVSTRIHTFAAEVDKLYDRITSCRVVVEAPHRHHRKGRLFHVRIELGLPGKELVIGADPKKAHQHEDVYVALRDAFDAAKRRIQDFARRRRGAIKTHEVPTHGRVTQIFPSGDYGFIESSDGREIYFHRHSVSEEGFEGLESGTEVRFELHEDESAKGPQASAVRPVGKHHLAPADLV